jgi:seryl-tRNA synthetase
MLDPVFVRDHLDVVRERLAARGTRMDAELDALAALDAERRTLIPKVEELKRQQNASGEEVARLEGRPGRLHRRTRRAAPGSRRRSEPTGSKRGGARSC